MAIEECDPAIQQTNGQDPAPGQTSPTDQTSSSSIDSGEKSATQSWKGKGRKALQLEIVQRVASLVSPTSPRDQETAPTRAWRTTVLRFGPLSGILAMLLAIASLTASLGILAGSNKQPVLSWSTPPSTYIAIFTAFANLFIRYAAIQGVVIAWWFRALKGSTLAKLHWDWRAGTTLRGALTAGRHMGLLGLACIFSTLVVVDGPLLQRATTVVPAKIIDHPVSLNISMAPEIPTDFSGYWKPGPFFLSAEAFNKTVPTNSGTASNHIIPFPGGFLADGVTQLWLDNAPLRPEIVQGCPGSCKLKLEAPALFPTCTSHTVPFKPYAPWAWERWFNEAVFAPPLSSEVVMTQITLIVSEGRETINLITGVANTRDCVGDLQYSICTLESGIGEYDATVDEKGYTTLDSTLAPRFLALANNTVVNHTFVLDERLHPSTLGGIVYSAWQRFAVLVTYYVEGGALTPAYAGNLPWPVIVDTNSTKEKCPSYIDQTDIVISSLNKLMVYLGAYAATHHIPPDKSQMEPGLSLYKTTMGHLQGLQDVFHTDYWFFFAAALIELVCIAFVLPTYWGWWKLGRPVSFSPLETAKAFESPMLTDYNSNSSGRDLANAVGDIHVQYGARAINQGQMLGFASPSRVSAPQNGSRFDA